MNDEKRPLNPHTGQPLPDEALDAIEHSVDDDVRTPMGVPAPAAGSAPAPSTSDAAPRSESSPATPDAGSTDAPSQQELAVRSALESVMDPEINLSVIDLGLIREIHLLADKTFIRMMLTTPFCPYAPQLMADVKQATEGVVSKPCEVEIMPDAWSPQLMPDPGLLGYSY